MWIFKIINRTTTIHVNVQNGFLITEHQPMYLQINTNNSRTMEMQAQVRVKVQKLVVVVVVVRMKFSLHRVMMQGMLNPKVLDPRGGRRWRICKAEY